MMKYIFCLFNQNMVDTVLRYLGKLFGSLVFWKNAQDVVYEKLEDIEQILNDQSMMMNKNGDICVLDESTH